MVAGTWHPLNTFNTAARLPLDLLVMISSFLCTGDLFTASQVCRHWRTTLVSSPLLWRKIDRQDLTRTIVSLDRHQSVPLQLDLYDGLSTEALDVALDHGSKVSSIFVHLPLDQLRELHRLPVTPSVEDLVLFFDEHDDIWSKERVTIDLRDEFVSLRKLSVSGVFASLNQTTAPNLIHLSLERLSSASRVSAQTVLDVLRGCPQLETVLINILSGRQDEIRWDTPVALPKLRSIELGHGEVIDGLVVPLHFPPTVAVGFRGIFTSFKSWPYYSIHHVLSTIDIESVTLAHIQHEVGPGYKNRDTCLVRFEGPTGSLEVVFVERGNHNPFGADWPMLSLSPQLNNVKTLYIMDCRISDDTLAIISAAMPNLVSINFTGHNIYSSSLTPKRGSPPLFPRLKHIAGLLPERKLVKMARVRGEHGMPLDALDVHCDPNCRDMRGYHAELRKFVGDVKVWQCADLPERWTSNALLDTWEAAGYPGPVSAHSMLENWNQLD